MIARKAAQFGHSLLYRLTRNLISEKLYYGQGGQLVFDLHKRAYEIQVETIWEDYAMLEIEGLTGVQNFKIEENQGKAVFNDEDLEQKMDEKIKVRLQVPQDYTLKGKIKGNIKHVASQVGMKMRSNPFKLQILGSDNVMQLGSLTTEKMSLANLQGSIHLSSLTVQQAIIHSRSFTTKKVMTSGQLTLVGDDITTKTLITTGKQKALINCRSFRAESLSGAANITAHTLGIAHVYSSGKDSIQVKCKAIDGVLGIETGTGQIDFESEEKAQKGLSLIKLGKMHKGSLKHQGKSVLIV